MLHFIGKLPRQCRVACSGGVDSMAVLSFLKMGKGAVGAAYFNHGTEHSERAEKFVKEYCEQANVHLRIGRVTRKKFAHESWEEYWRNERYGFLHSIDGPVVTAHNLNDCMETWIFSALHGEPKLIPYARQNVIRPFMITTKDEFKAWCERKKVPWLDDPSNDDVHYSRNRIRHNIMPEALKINPGLAKVIKKKLVDGCDSLFRSYSYVDGPQSSHLQNATNQRGVV